jgi:pSer/pThr/pTyr-binding forkhead associated (FHA) protein
VTVQTTTPVIPLVVDKARAYLEVVHGPNVGQRNLLLATEVTIGRAEDALIRLPHEDVSRVHARVVYEDDGFVIRDNESRNGTYVGGTLVHECVLHDGDLIQIGQTVLRFRTDHSETLLSPAAGGGGSVEPRSDRSGDPG